MCVCVFFPFFILFLSYALRTKKSYTVLSFEEKIFILETRKRDAHSEKILHFHLAPHGIGESFVVGEGDQRFALGGLVDGVARV